MGAQRSCAVGKKPLIGFNYPFPWNAYGIYLGGGKPPGSNKSIDAWTVNLKKNLIILRDELNIGIVRIFLLCNAANYGTVTGTIFTPPPALHPKFIEHLQKMFLAFRDTSTMVIPSLIDFKAFGRFKILEPGQPPKEVQEGSVTGPPVPPKDNGCTERHAIIKDKAVQEIFFKQTLEPFLKASIPFKTSIYAWEVQNEPTWNTRIFFNPDSIAGGRTVSESEMSAFLQKGINLIRQHGFQSTVGHRFDTDLDDSPTGSRRQFHFYPKTRLDLTVVDRHLPNFNDVQAFLGEFGVQAPGVGHGDLWLDLNGADAGSTRTRMLERLKFIRRQEYPLALVWPDGLDGRGKQSSVPGPDPLQLSPDAQQGIKDFMKLP